MPERTLGLRGAGVVVAFGLLASTVCLYAGKPLSLHEARLPQLAGEMLDSGSLQRWLLPHSGDRPWLERPPLPHWGVAAGQAIFGHSAAASRVAAVLAGVLTLLGCAYATARLLGRPAGVIAALLLATCYEFNVYAQQAEDDVFLAAIVAWAFALFVAGEQLRGEPSRWLGDRPWSVYGFFALAGLTAMAKGPGPGAVHLAAGCGGYVLFRAIADRGLSPLRFWLWPTGLIWSLILFLAWPAYAYAQVPSALDNWLYDFGGPFGHKPPWYYLLALPAALLPWTPVALIGLIELLRRNRSPARPMMAFFALAPLVALSIPARKHHHYLVPILWPWASLAAYLIVRDGPVWIAWLRPRLPKVRMWPSVIALVLGGIVLTVAVDDRLILAAVWVGVAITICTVLAAEGVRRNDGRLAVAGPLLMFALLLGIAQWAVYSPPTHPRHDLPRFAAQSGRIAGDAPLMIAAEDTMDFFALAFHAGRATTLLHNATYARADDLPADRSPWYVIARARNGDYFRDQIGETDLILQPADHGRGPGDPARVWTLFRVTPDARRTPLPREPADVMQAMERRAGPYLGEPPQYLLPGRGR